MRCQKYSPQGDFRPSSRGVLPRWREPNLIATLSATEPQSPAGTTGVTTRLRRSSIRMVVATVLPCRD